MFNDLPVEYQHEELDRNAYNAAFYELGFRWHWDRETYDQLLRHTGFGITSRLVSRIC